jgi:AraC-like DNA-binding protein
MTFHHCHTIYAESFFTQHAELFSPYLAKVGLSRDVLHSPGYEIPLSQYIGLWEVLGRELSPNIGLQVGLLTNCHGWGVWGHALRSAPTMQLVLHCLSHFIGVLSQGVKIDITHSDKYVGISYQIIDPLIIQRKQDAEFSIASGLSLIREVTGCPDLAPTRVEFEHGASSDLPIYKEVFNCPVHFNQPDNRLFFPASLLDRPVRTADIRLFQALEAFLEQRRVMRTGPNDLLNCLLRHVADSLSSGCPSIDQIAVTMNMGVRTLQRRLADYDLDFSHLVEAVRRSLAENYVSCSSHSITDIALLLGYTEASSFSRAFRRWMQLTPQQYRQQVQVQSSLIGA